MGQRGIGKRYLRNVIAEAQLTGGKLIRERDWLVVQVGRPQGLLGRRM